MKPKIIDNSFIVQCGTTKLPENCTFHTEKKLLWVNVKYSLPPLDKKYVLCTNRIEKSMLKGNIQRSVMTRVAIAVLNKGDTQGQIVAVNSYQFSRGFPYDHGQQYRINGITHWCDVPDDLFNTSEIFKAEKNSSGWYESKYRTFHYSNLNNKNVCKKCN